MKLIIGTLGIVTIVAVVLFLGGLVSPRLEAASLPACGIGAISGVLYLLFAARQGRVNRDRRDDDRARKLAAEIVRQQLEHRDTLEAQADLLATVQRDGFAAFWAQPDRVIHQALSAALGDRRLVVRDGKIIGVIPIQPRRLPRAR